MIYDMLERGNNAFKSAYFDDIKDFCSRNNIIHIHKKFTNMRVYESCADIDFNSFFMCM